MIYYFHETSFCFFLYSSGSHTYLVKDTQIASSIFPTMSPSNAPPEDLQEQLKRLEASAAPVDSDDGTGGGDNGANVESQLEDHWWIWQPTFY